MNHRCHYFNYFLNSVLEAETSMYIILHFFMELDSFGLINTLPLRISLKIKLNILWRTPLNITV